MRRMILMFATVIVVTTLCAAADSPLTVRIVSHPDRVPLGIARPLVESRGPVKGWVRVGIRAEVSNAGQVALRIVPASFWGYQSDLFTMYAVTRTEAGEILKPCRPVGNAEDVVLGQPRIDPGWTHELDVPVCLPGVGRYRVRVVAGETRGSYVNATGEKLDLWTGRSASGEVTIEVFAPEGVDKEAYEAFDHDPLGNYDRLGDLLRRFPTSTYAAYVVREYGAKGIASMPVDSLLGYVGGGTANLGNSVPDASGSWRSYSGAAFLEWRDRWFDLILENHPGIWFGDNLRFTKALDRYLLGDKPGCAAGLEALADHGRPEVAAKAKDLLAAMRAKGMLPEEG